MTIIPLKNLSNHFMTCIDKMLNNLNVGDTFKGFLKIPIEIVMGNCSWEWTFFFFCFLSLSDFHFFQFKHHFYLFVYLFICISTSFSSLPFSCPLPFKPAHLLLFYSHSKRGRLGQSTAHRFEARKSSSPYFKVGPENLAWEIGYQNLAKWLEEILAELLAEVLTIRSLIKRTNYTIVTCRS